MKKIIYLSILIILLIPFYHAFAKDTDIYVLDQSMEQIPPDALLILDLSLTMAFPPPGGKLYSSYSSSCDHEDGPFYPDSGTGHTYSCTWASGSAASSPRWGDSTACTGPFFRSSGTKTIDGVDINFNTDCSRLAIAKRAIFKLLDADVSGTIDSADEEQLNLRMGYMKFNQSCSGVSKPVGTSYSEINTAVQSENVGTYTALVSALTQTKTYFDQSKLTDPARDCRQKFAILISDGEDSVACGGPVSPPASGDYKRRRETVAKAKALADAGYMLFVLGFGGDMPHYLKRTLEWTAYYGNTNNPDISDVTTTKYDIPAGVAYSYPIGIDRACQNGSETSHTILGDPTHYYARVDRFNNTPWNDPGEYGLTGYAFFATNAAQLSSAIDAIRQYIINYNAESTSYVAPVVPISQMERTNSGNRMYLGMFKPTANSFWKGNIKKYGIATENTGTIKIGDIIDAKTPPEPVMDAWSAIKDSAKSYWSSVADGGEVDKGGVGEKLLERVFDNDLVGNPRNIYTYLGTDPNLTATINGFNLSNKDNIPLAELSVSTDAERQDLIRYVHGLNPYSETTSRTDGKRDWILGSFIHSRPAVVYYSETLSVVYAGGNDGMLHAFKANDDSGEELWAFIPRNLLPSLKNYRDELSLQFGVDASPRVYEDASTGRKYLIFGQRRGGNRYICLDITTATSPQLLWEISPSRTGYEELGQTWSTPKLGKIKNGAVGKWVAFIGGGYDDTHQDPRPPLAPPDTKGTAIYLVDILTGDPIWVFSKNTKDPQMIYSIPSDITCIDSDGDNFVDRFYVGDMGGRMWRFDIKDQSEKDDPTKWKGKIIFTATGKIFYPPDVSLERDASGNYEMLYFGTGDRENPKDTTVVNRLYAFKDRGTSRTESDLADITDYSVLSGDEPKFSQNGWYIRLEHPGEKCLAGAVIFGRGVYYTTYTPPEETDPSDPNPCRIGEGQGRIYIVNYLTGNAVFDLDPETTGMTKGDRGMDIGSGIPSGVIISIFGGNAVAYTGVGGGVYSPELLTHKTVIPINWRIIF
jgi:type IV pilus assembly protein PilY1